MPIGDFNVGKDVTLDVITETGPLRAAIRTGFSKKQDTSPITIKGADGVNRNAEVPEGWSGTLDYARADAVLDDYFADLEERYYSGLNSRSISITETIREVRGGVSQYRYTGVVLKLDDAGTAESDKEIKMRISWRATRRIKVA